jgi:HEPN domain-containing protein
MSDLPLSAEPDPREWLQFAENDLKAARALRGESDILPVVVGFHAPQCVEKAIKALLIHAGVRFPFTRDLEQLFALYLKHGSAIPFDFDALDDLSPYAGHRRYPGWIHQPGEKELQQIIILAEQVLAWAQAIVNSSAAPGGPPGGGR